MLSLLTRQEFIGFVLFMMLVFAPPVVISARLLAWWRLGPAGIPSRIFLTCWVGFLLLEMGCLLEGYYLEPHWVELVTERLPVSGLKPGTSLRIVHLSDTHFEGRPLDWSPQEVLKMVEEAHPDAICLTGDYLNDAAGAAEFSKFLSQIARIAPTFAVNGNWDRWTPEFLETFPNLGITQLHNEARTVMLKGQAVTFIGTDLYSAPRLSGLVKGLASGTFTVAMNHLPDYFELGASLSVNLMLAGHTHGGQIRVPGYGALITLARTGKTFEAGIYRVGNSWAHTSRGLGLEGRTAPRVRFCCRPEVTVLELEHRAPGNP